MALSLFAIGRWRATQQALGSSRPGFCCVDSASSLRLEHGGLAPHQHVAVTCECDPVLGLQLFDGAAAVALPLALLPKILGTDS
jgi:hypothetical protein